MYQNIRRQTYRDSHNAKVLDLNEKEITEEMK